MPSDRNRLCDCRSGLKYKKCHEPRVQGFLPVGKDQMIHKDRIKGTDGLDTLLGDMKGRVPGVLEEVLSKVYPYIIMPQKWWEEEPKKYNLFNFPASQIEKANMYKSGFLGVKFGLECFITHYKESSKESQKENGK